MSKEELWYREEIAVLFQLVLLEVGRVGHTGTDNEKASLVHLYGKLRRALETAPSMIAL